MADDPKHILALFGLVWKARTKSERRPSPGMLQSSLGSLDASGEAPRFQEPMARLTMPATIRPFSGAMIAVLIVWRFFFPEYPQRCWREGQRTV